MLLRLQRQNLLEFGGSDSAETPEGSEPSSMNTTDLEDLHNDKAMRKVFIDKLSGWKCKTNLQKKLLLGVLHRRGHKDFEEDSAHKSGSGQDHDGMSSLSISNQGSYKRNKTLSKNEQQNQNPKNLHRRQSSAKNNYLPESLVNKSLEQPYSQKVRQNTFNEDVRPRSS